MARADELRQVVQPDAPLIDDTFCIGCVIHITLAVVFFFFFYNSSWFPSFFFSPDFFPFFYFPLFSSFFSFSFFFSDCTTYCPTIQAGSLDHTTQHCAPRPPALSPFDPAPHVGLPAARLLRPWLLRRQVQKLGTSRPRHCNFLTYLFFLRRLGDTTINNRDSAVIGSLSHRFREPTDNALLAVWA